VLNINGLTQQLKRDDIFRWLAFGLIALAVVAFYFPTLYFPPRCDQVAYLAEIANNQHPCDLIFGTFDLNRHRVYAPGDELLFRPLLYMFLGTQQVILGHNFWAWQLVAMLAHLTLVWVLLRLLCHLSGPWLGAAGAWLFALSVTNYELVSWPHLTSYILMMTFVVLAFEQMVFCFEEQDLTWERIQRMLIYLSVACFIYETANIFTLLIMGVLVMSFPKMRTRSLVLSVPVVLYMFFSFYNYVYVHHVIKTISSHGTSVGAFLGSIVYVGSWWLYEGVFNGLYGYVMGLRTAFRPNEVLVFKFLDFSNVQVVLQLIILSAFGVLAWINRQDFFKKITPFIVLTGMLLAYVAVIVVGRYEALGSLKQAVGINSYYSYPFWIIVVMMAFVLIATKSKINRYLVIIFVTASLILGLLQGKRIYSMASDYSQRYSSTVLLVVTLDLLVKEKGNEPGFSFYVHPQYPGNYIFREVRKANDPPYKEYSFAQLLYPQYFRPRESAKYKLLIKN